MKKEYKTWGANALHTKHETTGKRMSRYLRNMPRKAERSPEIRMKALIGFSVAILWLCIVILASKAI